MAAEPDPQHTVEALLTSVRLLVRKIRQMRVDGELPLRAVAALKRLDREGAATSSTLARLEQITPQAMGMAVADLEARGLVTRMPDPTDGRRVLLSVTDTGRQVLRERRSTQVDRLAESLATVFTPAEQEQLSIAAPLLQRLAQSL